MKKKIHINNSKLNLTRERIAVLTDSQADMVRGGEESPGKSTRNDFTCTWCTTIIPPPDDIDIS